MATAGAEVAPPTRLPGGHRDRGHGTTAEDGDDQTLGAEVVDEPRSRRHVEGGDEDDHDDGGRAPQLGENDGDDEIDRLNAQIYQHLLDQMAKDPALIGATIPMTSIVKNLERIGDLAVSIAEMVVFTVSGKDIRHITSLKAASRLLDDEEGR